MHSSAGFGMSSARWFSTRWSKLLVSLAALACADAAMAGEAYPLGRLEELARSNPALRAAATEIDGARAGVQTARAYPNPEVEYMAGSMNYRPYASGISGASDSYSITQSLDLPFRRTPRIAAARAGLEASKAGYAAVETDWIADLRLAYFGALRRTAEKANAQTDLSLMQSVYAKISLRVEQGDAPRIELIRAEADLLNVQKAAQAAALREDQARLQLRTLVGPDLPEDFALTGQLDAPLPLPSLGVLQEQALAANPALARARAEVEQARHRLDYEESGRLPVVSLRATREADREMRQTRVGVTVSIPLWDRKLGPVHEAEARRSQSDLQLTARTYAIRQELGIAWRQYEVAQTQVAALENGLIAQTRAAVNVADAAYKAGERGLIDVLDAQRVYRAARADLIASRYELAAAWVDIQRLVASPEPLPVRNIP
ncbi:TolC family protein [Novosphingobium rosa]|uniref:TolC family protein n=1 Tax=Novosphingobium rosa TaxID=76978 RepID=UPI000A4779F7|nr:TolC family protein [Novosphingobium rosa]